MEIQLWREILTPYDLAVKELVLNFEHMIKEFRSKGMYSPIEQVEGRVKKISSILDKVQKKKIHMDEFEERVEDIAGIRITCQFSEDIEKVVQLIRERNDIEIKSEKDYIDTPKPSGYRSYHMIVYYVVNTLDGPKRLQVEIQIRTMAMDFWATAEHSLQYKYKGNIPEHLNEKLLNAANAVVALDKEMSAVRHEIMDAQNSFQIKANVVATILTNIQNLYKVANKREVVKIQDEFYRIYEEGGLDQLIHFSHQLDHIAEGYRAQDIN